MNKIIELGKLTDTSIIKEQNDRFSEKFSTQTVPPYLKAYHNASKTVKSKQQETNTAYGILDCVEPPYNMKYLAKLYETSAIHAGAVDAKTDNIVGLGWYLGFSQKAEQLRINAGKKADKTDDDKQRDALEKKLDRDKASLKKYISDLNSIDEFDETLTKCMKDLFTTGNGYLEVSRNAEGQIAYLGHVPSVDIRIRKKRDGFIQLGIEDAIFFRNFGDRKTRDPAGKDPRPNELIHFKTYTPSNNYYGVPDIVSAIEAVAGIEFASRYNIEYFENKAIPKHVIKVKNMDLDATQLSKLTKFFETSTENQSHRTVVIPIDGVDSDITFEAVESSKQDSSFSDYTEKNIQMILSRHRVPKNRLGISEGQGLSSSRDADKIFKESVCQPIQRLVEKKIQKVMAEITDLFEFKLEEYSLTDEEAQTKIDEIDIRSGALLPDERRVKLGLQRRPDGEGDKPAGLRDLALLGKNSPDATSPASRALADSKVQAQGSRAQDRDRATTRPDGTNSRRGRNPKGEGRQVS